MKARADDTPPASPSIGSHHEDDELYEDEVAEEVDLVEGEADVRHFLQLFSIIDIRLVQGDMLEGGDEEEDELVELPGGIDQLETMMEEHERETAAASAVDESKLVFRKHTGSVFCLAANMSEGLVVTGGEDDLGHVWRLEDGEVVFTLSDWTDSVTEIAWNRDCSLLAAGDLAGNIKVWRYPGYKLVWSFELGQDLLWLRWHGQAQVLVAGTGEGQVWVWRVPGGESKVLGGSGARVECGEVMQDGRRAVAGYSDGAVKVWDMKSSEQVHSLTGVHSEAVVNLTLTNTNLLLTGSSDGSVGLWNCTNGKNVGILLPGDSDNGVEAVVAASSGQSVFTGTLGGQVSLWDVSSQVSKWQLAVSSGPITRLVVGGEEEVLYCATEEGVMRAVDTRTGEAVAEWRGHSGPILDLVVSGQTGLTASDDGTARVWDVRVTR